MATQPPPRRLLQQVSSSTCPATPVPGPRTGRADLAAGLVCSRAFLCLWVCARGTRGFKPTGLGGAFLPEEFKIMGPAGGMMAKAPDPTWPSLQFESQNQQPKKASWAQVCTPNPNRRMEKGLLQGPPLGAVSHFPSLWSVHVPAKQSKAENESSQ